ncbi:unnamed protein product [Lactuca virosa]|uniref:Uncharacterized protein n=1 Tax=Lactuca virosa TaxID=75947 RepID=A0AAU9NCQ6_9ASTR|nr:unnamed protein product [Lactuca virosa]
MPPSPTAYRFQLRQLIVSNSELDINNKFDINLSFPTSKYSLIPPHVPISGLISLQAVLNTNRELHDAITEEEVEGLKGKLSSKLAANSPNIQPNWQF